MPSRNSVSGRPAALRLVAAVVGVVSIAMTLGSAASLNVSGGAVQAGGDSDLKCDLNGVKTDYSVTFIGGEFKVSDVEVSGFHNDCISKVVEVHLTQGGTSVGSASGTVQVLGPSNNRSTGLLTVSPQPPAASVDDVHVLVVDDAGP